MHNQVNFQEGISTWAHPRYGVGGASIDQLSQGTPAYSNMLTAVQSANPDYSVFDWIHGETDRAEDPSIYQAKLEQLWTDVKADIGSSSMFVDQFSAVYNGNTNVWPVNFGLHQTAIDNADVYMVGPKYQYRIYYTDLIHLNLSGYRFLANQHGKVIHEVVYGNGWTPLQPNTITYDGATTVEVKLDVPVLPLQIDTTTLPPHPVGCLGFEIVDSAATCTGATVAGDTVTITLDQPLADFGAGSLVRYAWSGDAQGPFGNIKDSDTTPLEGGYPANNWLVHFEREIN